MNSISTTLVRSTDKQLEEKEKEIYYKPEFISLSSYENEDELREKLKPLQYFNRSHQHYEFQNSLFFVLRSKKTNDLHKAIKYGVWTSSPQNNKKIESAFHQKKASGGNVFFVYTYLNAPGFVGLARLTNIDLSKEFPFFGEIGRWIGIMHIEWVYVRDVLFEDVQDLQEPAFDGGVRYMSDMTDGSKLNQHNYSYIIQMMNEGKEMSAIFKRFLGHDQQEKAQRVNVDEIIRNNMMEIYKQKAQKKVEEGPQDAKKNQKKEEE